MSLAGQVKERVGRLQDRRLGVGHSLRCANDNRSASAQAADAVAAPFGAAGGVI